MVMTVQTVRAESTIATSVQHSIKIRCCREENDSVVLFSHPENGTYGGQVNAQAVREVIVTPFQTQLIYLFALVVMWCIDSCPDG